MVEHWALNPVVEVRFLSPLVAYRRGVDCRGNLDINLDKVSR